MVGVPGRLQALVLCGALLAAAPAAAGAAEGAARLSGKVSLQREGVEGARVYAFASLEEMVADSPAALSEPTAGDGLYGLDLPAGTYYLTARREAAGPPADPFFAYHGSNPFFISPGTMLEVNFPLAPVYGTPRVEGGDDPSAGTLSGVVMLEGEPSAGVRVKLYLDGESDFRGMGYALSPPTGPDGVFAFDFLPESSYWIVAHRRSGGTGAGPLAEGDAYGFYAGNPVDVASGTAVSVILAMAGKGADTGGAEGRPLASGTSITGRISDSEGAVVPGTYAFAYRGKLMSHAKPEFLSREVGSDGRYVMHLSEGGTYYVGARTLYGDAPSRGEWYGRYDGTPDHSVTVVTGSTLEGIDITVERIMP